jgi:polar amino acid transport system substrate-binding protein
VRRFMTLVAAATLVSSLAACGSSSKPSAGSTSTTAAGSGDLFSKLPAKIQSSKEIKVGSDIEYAPIEFYKVGTTTTQGVDYDLAQALGAKLGVKFTFIDDTDFAGIIGAMKAGRFDIIMSAMNDTPDRRAKGADFVDYFTAGTSIIVQKGNPKNIQKLDDLCGTTVAVQKGTVQDLNLLTPQVATCKTASKPLNVLRFEKDTDALQQVKNGRAVANLEDFPVAAYNAQTSGGGNDFTAVDVPGIGPGDYGIALLKTNTQLRDAVQSALKEVIADGTYDQIMTKWNVTAGALKTATVNAGA